jgi:hypothetical protein
MAGHIINYDNSFIFLVISKDVCTSAFTIFKNNSIKGKTIPVTGCEGPWGCETLRIPHFVDNRLTDAGEIVSLTRQPPFTPRKIPGTHFC